MSRPFAWLTLIGPALLLALAGAGPMPAASPHAERFAVAGIAPGMDLADAVAEMHQTFATEGLTDIHAVSVAVQQGEGGAMRRLTLQQSASTPTAGLRNYREDRFKLRLAGPPGQERVTALTRDYLAPVGLNRAAVLKALDARFGRPSASNVPDATIAPNSAVLSWMFAPHGAQLGGGAQGSTELTCGNGMLGYVDAFDNAADNDTTLVSLLHGQRKQGCGLMLQVNFAFDAVHFELFDSAAALSAIAGLTDMQPVDRAAKAKARALIGAEAADAIRY